MAVTYLYTIAVLLLVYDHCNAVNDNNVFHRIGVGKDLDRDDRNGKTFTYTIVNTIQEPYFTESIQLNTKKGTTLLSYMEQACMADQHRFTKFTATFYPSVGGYYVDSINGAFANFTADNTYWEILNQDGPLKVGVSEYVPKKNDVVLFILTKYTGPSF